MENFLKELHGYLQEGTKTLQSREGGAGLLARATWLPSEEEAPHSSRSLDHIRLTRQV